MTAKHTPGPWETGDQDRSIFAASNGPLIALIPNRQPANAQLIAAAPELLTALKILADEAEKWNGVPQSAIDAARAAIAKAEGKQS